MSYIIEMGIPEMKKLWDELNIKYANHTILSDELLLFKKLNKAIKLLSENPRHPSLQSHEIDDLTKIYGNGRKIWQSYVENRKKCCSSYLLVIRT